jgi:predicted nucleotidyltransferase
MSQETSPPSFLAQLQSRLNCRWAAIAKARADSEQMQAELQRLFTEQKSPDTSVVVFGSVARGEVTQSSDLDWILLIDGQSVPEHKDQQRRVERTLADNKYIEPGKSGVFGTMVGSHELVHNIGGEDDLNSNTTRRVLLLLESLAVGDREAYDRFRLQILRRYIEDDRGLLYGSGDVRIPRFLLNDITRYWRTVTVDFVYKQRADNDKKWALRNAKLRMSRKLVFAAGLLHCFFCHLDEDAAAARDSLSPSTRDSSLLIEYLRQQLALDPLEILAKACVRLSIGDETARRIFDSYDTFLSILDDRSKRDELAEATQHADLRDSKSLEGGPGH